MEAKVFERRDYTEEEYFEMFDKFERKIEFHNGNLEMMAGAPSAHNDLATNLRKDKKTWIMQSLWEDDQTLSIPTLGEELSLKEIYQGVFLLEEE